MEPFGLMQLLSNLLPKPAEKSEEPAPSAPPTPPPDAPVLEEKPNACVGFFEAHNRRAGRRR